MNDCSQEVWQNIVKLAHFRQDPDRGRLSTWMMTLAHNKAVDSIRRRNRQVFKTLEDNEAIARRTPGLDPAAEYERRQAWPRSDPARALRESLADQLPGAVPRWIEGRPTSEVAAALELTPNRSASGSIG